MKHGDKWYCIGAEDDFVKKELPLLKLFDGAKSIDAQSDNLWIVDGQNRLFRIDLSRPARINPEINVFIKSIYNENKIALDLTNVVFSRGDKFLNFDIVAPGYLKQNTTQYQYTVSKLMTDWSSWSTRNDYSLMVSAAGEYTLKVRAKDLWGI